VLIEAAAFVLVAAGEAALVVAGVIEALTGGVLAQAAARTAATMADKLVLIEFTVESPNVGVRRARSPVRSG